MTKRNLDVSHKQAVADGGSPNDPANYEPKPRDEHMREHKERGDFKRWGARGAAARKGVTRGLGAASAIGAVPGMLDLRETLEVYPDLPFSLQFGVLGGAIDPAGIVRMESGEYLYVPAWAQPGT